MVNTRVTEDQIEQAKRTDLLSYLKQCEPDNLIRLGVSTYCTKDHDSLKISNGLWHWFSRNIGGKNALDYLIKVRGLSFTEAVSALTSNYVPIQTERVVNHNAERKSFELPSLSPDIVQVRRYLTRRGIDGRLIDFCHRKGLIYEDASYHNCIFVGRDESGVPRYGAVRSTVSNFKRELEGSDKRYSFRITPTKEAKTVHLFEAAIDLLSYITLDMMAHHERPEDAFLSLGGVYANRGDHTTVPPALKRFLDRNAATGTVILHLDNDEVGRQATEQIMRALDGKYVLDDDPPKRGKDFNDYLKKEIERREISR